MQLLARFGQGDRIVTAEVPVLLLLRGCLVLLLIATVATITTTAMHHQTARPAPTSAADHAMCARPNYSVSHELPLCASRRDGSVCQMQGVCEERGV